MRARVDLELAGSLSIAIAFVTNTAPKAHALGRQHIASRGETLDYHNFAYFKYVIVGDPNSCLEQRYQQL
jgi:hypothetical protein